MPHRQGQAPLRDGRELDGPHAPGSPPAVVAGHTTRILDPVEGLRGRARRRPADYWRKRVGAASEGATNSSLPHAPNTNRPTASATWRGVAGADSPSAQTPRRAARALATTRDPGGQMRSPEERHVLRTARDRCGPLQAWIVADAALPWSDQTDERSFPSAVGGTRRTTASFLHGFATGGTPRRREQCRWVCLSYASGRPVTVPEAVHQLVATERALDNCTDPDPQPGDLDAALELLGDDANAPAQDDEGLSVLPVSPARPF